ncbi:RNA polymerase sigma factor [Spirosoma oryzicola]|uniref:RNA polymerase sigma factor n=1 Tax=Spirosoma oryzicola TaxID=2898794 RepID=UPI001E50CA69|nr:sigma-70 family RNA polymerase sigma factor [Spirosoma oryzicola]UHG94475.1 sigma-70 family RNA polymerase sigma factor [Spirosoma oryzicola]
MTTTPQTEAYLVYTLQTGQASAFATLHRNYSSALFNVLVGLVGDYERAEDLLQDSFVKIWTHIHHYDPAQGRLYTWLLTITRNVALDELRSRKVHTKAVKYISQRSSELTQPVVNTGLVNGSVFALLPPKQRQIMELLYQKGWTLLEIAKKLKLPLGTVKTRVRMAIQTLKQFFHQDICLYR